MRRGMATSALLAVSALLGLAILGTDHNLWNYEPSHAYGLIAFVVIDLAAIFLILWKGSRNILRLGGAWGGIFALTMVSDIYSGGASSMGFDQNQFAVYLFGLGQYDTNHIAFLFPALFVVNILAAFVGFLESRGQGGDVDSNSSS